MRKQRSDVLEMFQDPLLTTVALILLNTVWMIIPRPPEPIDMRSIVAQNELDSLKVRRRTLEKQAGEAATKSRELNEKLAWVENQISKAREQGTESQTQEDLTQALIAKLQSELKEKQEALQKFEQTLPDTVGTTPSPIEGISLVRETDKLPFLMEAVNGRLFPVDENHYEVLTGYIKMEDGRMVPATQKSRRASARGEDIAAIAEPASRFNKALRTLNTEEEYVVFLVHSDSFGIFRKAREIALNKRFEIGWVPFERESIILSAGGRKVGPSGRQSR